MRTRSTNYFKYCPKCKGRLSIRRKSGVERLVCSECNFVFYQNSKPTASAFFTNNQGQILLVKRNIEPKYGYWDAAGGFLEEGEDPIKGVKREIKEELGVTIKINRLVGIYMDWYMCGYNTSTLNIIYEAKVVAGKMEPMSDVGVLKWFDRKNIPWGKLAFKWMKPALKDWLKR